MLTKWPYLRPAGRQCDGLSWCTAINQGGICPAHPPLVPCRVQACGHTKNGAYSYDKRRLEPALAMSARTSRVTASSAQTTAQHHHDRKAFRCARTHTASHCQACSTGGINPQEGDRQGSSITFSRPRRTHPLAQAVKSAQNHTTALHLPIRPPWIIDHTWNSYPPHYSPAPNTGPK